MHGQHMALAHIWHMTHLLIVKSECPVLFYLYFCISSYWHQEEICGNMSLPDGQMERAPGRVTCIPPWNWFETRHGLIPMEMPGFMAYRKG